MKDPVGAEARSLWDIRPQLAARTPAGARFSYFFVRNPLKRLDSEKKMKVNESKFTSV
jgi:hypothetical protein